MAEARRPNDHTLFSNQTNLFPCFLYKKGVWQGTGAATVSGIGDLEVGGDTVSL